MNERGAPTPVAWTRLRAPESLMGPADPSAMEATVKASPRYATYAQSVDRESAREKLAARLEEGARKAEEDAKLKEQLRQEKLDKAADRKKADDGGLIHDVVSSSAFKDFLRTAAREVARGMFKSARR
ncbi:MAG: helicase HerA-like domain-containing protein [Nocardioides sp.]